MNHETTIKLEITTTDPVGVLKAVRYVLRGAATIQGRPSIRKATPMPMRTVDAVGEVVAMADWQARRAG